MEKLSRESLFVPFFENQVFLLSGATGFLGKLLLHKLLTSLPNLPPRSIYVIVRGKNDLPAQQRFEQLLFEESLIFKGTLNQQVYKDKIRVVDGDMTLRKLGLSQEDYEEICERCTIFIHMAATVNFNENLRKSVELNVFGVKRMLELARRTKNLKAFLHTSTTYVNSPRFKLEIKEKLYPVRYDPDVMAEKIFQMTEEEAEYNTSKIISPHPNTYTYTKFLAEHIVMKERGVLPVAIVRPCIIGSSMSYPIPGWVDSYTAGPAGVMLAAGLGVIHVMHGNTTLITEMVPVDVVVNTLIAVSYALPHQLLPNIEYPVFHCATGHVNPTTWGDCVSIIMGQFMKHPHPKKLSRPWLYVPTDKYYKYWELVLSTFPAYLMDKRAQLVGAKANNSKKMDVMKNIISVLSYFTTHEWIFQSDNVVSLNDKMNLGDRELFNIDVSARVLDWELYWINFKHGLVKYLMKDLSKDEMNWLVRSKL